MNRNDLSRLFSAQLIAVVVVLSASASLLAAPSTDLTVHPRVVELSGPRARQQVVVTSADDRGRARDVTERASYAVDPPELASVTDDGIVTPLVDGTGRLVVSYEGMERSVELRSEGVSVHSPTSFRREVVAVLSKAGCNMGACHGNLNGKGGFRLSLRGEDSGFDLGMMTRDNFARRIDLAAPSSSLILGKPTGALPHEGGVRFSSRSLEARTFKNWVAEGARDDHGTLPELASLSVYPPDRILRPGETAQRIAVTATYADGRTEDVTRRAAFDLSDPTVAEVSVDGGVKASRPSEVTVAVRYLNGRTISRLAFLADREDFAWPGAVERTEFDRHVFRKLKTHQVAPSRPADDTVFLRRAYLDALGRLPSPDEARAFLADQAPKKRDVLVDSLLGRPEFADNWALKWADLLRNEEKTMGEKGVWVFQRWLRDQVSRDAPLDEFARAMIDSSGSTWSNPPANFYRTNRDPETAAETFAQVFLGVRLQCARCHNHPFDAWTQDDYYGLAAAFSNVKRKQVNNVRRDALDKHEINGDEVIYTEGATVATQPRTGAVLPAKAPQGRVLTGGTSPRGDLASWLTSDNRQFARNLANRVWFHLMGRGVVEPVDDFRESNPPSNPELLDALTDEFIAGGLRLRPLVALVMKSEVYQLDAVPNETNADDGNFSRAFVRLLPAETLLDTISQALGVEARFDKAPAGSRASQLPGVKSGENFLKAFGKPDRLLTCECERSEATSLSQAFLLINGATVRSKLEAKDNRIGGLLSAGLDDDAILDELYLATLSRSPRDSERATFLGHVRDSGDRRRAWEDVAWALINSKEFLLRH